MKREPKTHDYTRRYWGHDYTFKPEDEGRKATLMGWGRGIVAGDYLLLVNPANADGKARYQVRQIDYYRDPSDMWAALVIFAPRPAPDAVPAVTAEAAP